MNILFGFLLLVLGFAATSCNTTSSNDFVLGEIEAMTGNEAAFGVSTHRGVELAIDEINATGGVAGRKLRVVVSDDQGKTDETALSASKLIVQDQALALLSGGNSSRSLAIAPIAQRSRIPFLATGATNPKVTAEGEYIFRTCFIDPFQGVVMARFAAKTLSLKKVAILKDLRSDYSIGLSEFFATTFKKEGGQIVAEQTYSFGEVDFKSQLTSLLAKNPDAIFIPGYYTEVGLIARQAKELGSKAVLIGGDGWDSPKLKEIAGLAIAGGFFSSQYSPESTDAHVQEFIRAYKARYGIIPDASAALGYDGAKVLADAIRRATKPTSAGIRDALAATKNFVGATGNVRIDENRNAVKPAAIIHVDEQGEFRFHSNVAPF